MAASMALRRQLCSLGRILSGATHSHLGVPTTCSSLTCCPRIRPRPSFHAPALFSTGHSSITVTDEPDTLFQRVSLLVKGHDRAVLDSYEFFVTMAANGLGLRIDNVYEPKRDIERLTLLKSVHIFKKHRVQYEMRTHYRCIELSHITGSTAQVYLEYIERNLPEGVAMEVTKTTMEKIPDHILEPMWNDQPAENKPAQ
ncbi:small ribosomal subunit protein uS10m isoform X2 [Takifugu rubripes]|uniref:Small ribosomal subunit protein uS10m n=1 Tax=Takifugu rubripes TaxID=31033 RepID=H2TC03_TAKRU|nr:28S ribosomal protein S10, mitochondrial isoform X2 [Takifugu rubripes]|eukprot:XP_011615947.1 PREDICTED: 28S ribosomal protein S10, mitochondrial isoform X2 [Takifugu rubripes]